MPYHILYTVSRMLTKARSGNGLLYDRKEPEGHQSSFQRTESLSQQICGFNGLVFKRDHRILQRKRVGCNNPSKYQDY